MKQLVILVTLLFLVSAVSAQSEKTAGELVLDGGVKPHVGIDGIYSTFSRGYRDLDWQMVVNLYTQDAIYMTPASGVDRGRDFISRNFESFFSSIKKSGAKMSIAFQIVERKVSGDLAYDVGIYTLTIRRPEGGPQISRGKFVVIALRQNGAWKFQLDSYSDLPKPK